MSGLTLDRKLFCWHTISKGEKSFDATCMDKQSFAVVAAAAEAWLWHRGPHVQHCHCRFYSCSLPRQGQFTQSSVLSWLILTRHLRAYHHLVVASMQHHTQIDESWKFLLQQSTLLKHPS